MASTRVHIVIPKELTDEIDSLVGQRKRSAFIYDAAKEKLIRYRQAKAIQKFSGTLRDVDYPEWKDGSADWVHKLRQEDRELQEARLKWTSSEPPSDRHKHNHRRSQRKARSR